MLSQIQKFYLASFLKNQTYFVPIIIIFFQDLGLSYSEIFWIFTIGAVFSFFIEIPTGIFADLYGKRKSIILSKLFIACAFLAFGFADSFITLLLANVVYEVGKSFRSGTETAFVFDYLKESNQEKKYSTIKANQKFYARISESIATAVGGFIATLFGFNMVFLIAAIPATLNFLQTLTWAHIKEHDGLKSFAETLRFARTAIKDILLHKDIRRIVLNILMYSSLLAAVLPFVQPYMVDAGIPLESFGLVYTTFLILVAFLVRYVSKLEDAFGSIRIINVVTLLSCIPLLILGFGFTSLFGVILFFLLIMVENLRSPIANALFHETISSDNRATMGSILELFKTAGTLIILPAVGYIADWYSMYTALLILGLLLCVTAVMLWIPTQR
jgi:MFS family permease